MIAASRTRPPWWTWPLVVALLPVLAVVLVVASLALFVWLIAAIALQLAVWVAWCSRGRYALVVYSNSPVWQQYFEQQVLPAVGSRGQVLNWSERKRWPTSFPVVLFRVFAGGREFNPWAIVFRPLAWPRQFRFYRAFKSFKHGRPQEVEELRRDLLDLLDKLAPADDRRMPI